MRRSLGVSEDAQADSTVAPAPPVDPTLPEEDIVPKPLADHINANTVPMYEDENVSQIASRGRW